MRYCPFCRRFNPGRPPLCHYCGRSWQVRLCPRGHVSPPDAQYCGTCGSVDLTDTAGPEPWWLRLIKTFIIVTLLLSVISFCITLPQSINQAAPLIIAIAFIVFGYSIVLNAMPLPIKGLLMVLPKVIKKMTTGFVRWCWEKLKLMIS